MTPPIPLTSGFLAACWRACRGVLVVALLAGVALGARADAVKLGGSWIQGVQDVHVAEGRVFYTTASGSDVDQGLENLQGLKLDSYPDLATATAAMDAHHDADALAPLARVLDATHEPWLQQWVLGQEVRAMDAAGQPQQAVAAYLRLVNMNAEKVYLTQPPVVSLKKATPEQKSDLRQVLAPVQANPNTLVADAVKRMLAALGASVPAHVATPGGNNAVGQTADSGSAHAPAPSEDASGVASAIPLPKAMDASDPIRALLEKGKFQAAEDAAKEALKKPKEDEPLAMRLYQLGVAQLYLAQARHDQNLCMDAGLNFMRVITYFDKSSYYGPSLIEVGLVHDMIGRHDLAAKLWDRAKLHVGQDEDPALYARLEKLIADSAQRHPKPKGP